MKRMITILATALLASSLLAGAADARGGGGGGGGGHGGGFGGGGHMGGGFGGGGHIGGFGGGGHIGGIGGEHMGRPRRRTRRRHIGAHGFGLHQHALHRFGGYGPGYGYYGYPDCYDWYVPASRQPLAAELQLSPRANPARGLTDRRARFLNALRADIASAFAPPSRSSRCSTGTGEPP